MDTVPTNASGEDRVDSLSTDELREEVARLHTLLLKGKLEEDSDVEEELQFSDEGGTLSLVEDATLRYTNGDVYKVGPLPTYSVVLNSCAYFVCARAQCAP